jgi:hypothetical protein
MTSDFGDFGKRGASGNGTGSVGPNFSGHSGDRGVSREGLGCLYPRADEILAPGNGKQPAIFALDIFLKDFFHVPHNVLEDFVG